MDQNNTLDMNQSGYPNNPPMSSVPYTPFQHTPLSSLSNFNPLNPLNPNLGMHSPQDMIKNEMERFKAENIGPLLDQLKELKPMIERQQKEDVQKSHDMKKHDFMNDLDFLINLYPLISSLIDKPRLSKLMEMYKDEIVDYAIRSGSPVKGSIDGAKRIATRELLNFVKTPAGKQWVTLGLDSIVGQFQQRKEQGLI